MLLVFVSFFVAGLCAPPEPVADIRVAFVGPAQIVAGFDAYTLTIEVSNSGLSSSGQFAVATDVSVRLSFPQIAGVSFDEPVGCVSWDASSRFCALGVKQPGESSSVVVSFVVNPGLIGQTLEVCAEALGTANDFVPSNNNGCFSRLIASSASVSLQVEGLENRLAGDFEQFPFSFSYHNLGYSTTHSTVVSLVVPSFLNVQPPLPMDCALEVGPTMVCSLGSVNPGETRQKSFFGQISAGTPPGAAQLCPRVISTTFISAQPPCFPFTVYDLRVSGRISSIELDRPGQIEAGGVDGTLNFVATAEGEKGTSEPSVEIQFPEGLLLTYLPPGCHTRNGLLRCDFSINQTASSLSFSARFRALGTAAAGPRPFCITAKANSTSALTSGNCQELTVVRNYDLNKDGEINQADMDVIPARYLECVASEQVRREIRKRQSGSLAVSCPSEFADRLVSYFSVATVSGTSSGFLTTRLVGGTRLPAGLFLDGATSEIGGTPTEPVGLVSFRLQVSDGVNFSPITFCNINVGTIPSFNTQGQPAPNGRVGEAYAYSFNVIASSNLVLSLSGNVPSGISFVTNGPTITLAGTPQASGSFSFQFNAVDQAGGSSSLPFSITIAPADGSAATTSTTTATSTRTSTSTITSTSTTTTTTRTTSTVPATSTQPPATTATTTAPPTTVKLTTPPELLPCPDANLDSKVDIDDIVVVLDAIDRSVSRNHVFSVEADSISPLSAVVSLVDTITFNWAAGSPARRVISGLCGAPNEGFPSSASQAAGSYTISVSNIVDVSNFVKFYFHVSGCSSSSSITVQPRT